MPSSNPSDTIPDLLPTIEELEKDTPRTPIDILQQQAMLLREKTEGQLLAEVESISSDFPKIVYWFSLLVPSLSGYKLRLFRVSQEPNLYPLIISDVSKSRDLSDKEIEVKSENDLYAVLRRIFSDADIMKTMRSIRASAQAADGRPGGLNLINLDKSTRSFMLQEFETDLTSGKLYLSPRLTELGKSAYPELLRTALDRHDDAWLAKQLAVEGRLLSREKRKGSAGEITVKVPVTAPYTLAEGEFNRYYARGLCLRAIKEGTINLLIYRAKEVTSPRSESEALIGRSVSPQALLEDLRTHIGLETALGLPQGPNSGLSVRLP